MQSSLKFIVIALSLFMTACATQFDVAETDAASLVDRMVDGNYGTVRAFFSKFDGQDLFPGGFTWKGSYKVPSGTKKIRVGIWQWPGTMRFTKYTGYLELETRLDPGESYYTDFAISDNKAKLWIIDSKGNEVSSKIEIPLKKTSSNLPINFNY